MRSRPSQSQELCLGDTEKQMALIRGLLESQGIHRSRWPYHRGCECRVAEGCHRSVGVDGDNRSVSKSPVSRSAIKTACSTRPCTSRLCAPDALNVIATDLAAGAYAGYIEPNNYLIVLIHLVRASMKARETRKIPFSRQPLRSAYSFYFRPILCVYSQGSRVLADLVAAQINFRHIRLLRY